MAWYTVDTMVVATEFYDRRPQRTPAPARRRNLPAVRFVYRTVTPTSHAHEGVASTPLTTDTTPYGECADLVATWNDQEKQYRSLRDRVIYISGGTLRQVEAIFHHLPGYVRYQKAESVVLPLLQRSYSQWTETAKRRVQRAITDRKTVIENWRRQVEQWETEPERVVRLLSTVPQPQHANAVSDRNYNFWINELAERRAYLRAHVKKAIHQLDQLSDRTPREESLRASLDRFAPLEDFPHVVTEDAEALALQAVLAELESLFQSLLPSMSIIRDPASVDTAVETDSSVTETAAPEQAISPAAKTTPEPDVDMAASDSSQKETAPKHSPRNSAGAIDIHPPAHTSPDPTPRKRTVELGTYDVQWGDTLGDILTGQSDAELLPIFDLLRPAQQQQVIIDTVDVLDHAPALCAWIGVPHPASDLPNLLEADGQVSLDLDKLHDLVSLITLDHGLIKMPAAKQKKMQQELAAVLEAYGHTEEDAAESVTLTPIESLHDLWPAMQSYFSGGVKGAAEPARATVNPVSSVPTEVPPELQKRTEAIRAQAIKHHHNDDESSFREAAHAWADAYLRVRRQQPWFSSGANQSDEVSLLQLLEPVQLDTVASLLADTPERTQWLRVHRIPKKAWVRAAQAISKWQEELAAESCHHNCLTVGQLVRTVYALQCLDTLRQTD